MALGLTEVDICEMALDHLGVSGGLTSSDGSLANVTDTGQIVDLLNRWFTRVRDKTQADFPWRFARGFATLTLVVEGSDGTTVQPWASDWLRALSYPSDCLVARRFTGDRGRGYWPSWTEEFYWPYGRSDWAFVVATHQTTAGDHDTDTKVILTDLPVDGANLEYTRRITRPVLYDEHFADALSYHLASKIATPITDGPERAQGLMQAYHRLGTVAEARSANESNEYPEPDGDFMRARAGR